MGKIWIHIFLASFIFIIFTAVFNISKYGLQKKTLLDEFAPNAPEVIAYQKYAHHFNQQEKYEIYFKNKNHRAFSDQDLLILNKVVTTKFSSYTWINNFYNLEKIQLPEISKNELSLISLIRDDKINTEVKTQLSQLNSFKDFPLSHDQKIVRMPFELKSTNDRDTFKYIKTILTSLNEISKDTQFEAHLIGLGFLRYSIYQEVLENYTKLFPFVVIIVAFALYFFYRSITVIAITLATLLFTFLTTTSVSYLIEGALSPFSSISLLFVFIIGTSDIIHLISHTAKISQNQGTKFRDSLPIAVKEIIKPCFMTSLTTMIGLAVLCLSPFHTLKIFGLNGLIGISICFITSFYLLPYILEQCKITINLRTLPTNKFLTHLTTKHPKTFLSIGFLFLLFLGSQATDVELKDSFFNKFTDNHPLSKSIKINQKYFHNLSNLDLFGELNIFSGNKYKSLKEEILKLQNVSSIKSISDYVDDLNSLVKDRSTANSLALQAMYSGQLANLVSQQDVRFAREVIFLKKDDADSILKTTTAIRELLKKYTLAEDLKLSGYTLLREGFMSKLKENYLNSLWLSLILIFILFCLFYKSLFLGVIAMLPNIAAPLSVMAMISLFNIEADMNLPLICSLALAIAVDDTIHFFHHYLLKIKHMSIEDALIDTLKSVSQPLIATTCVICCSILVLLLGNIRLFSQFSALMCAALAISLFYDLMVLPAILLLLGKGKSLEKKV